MSTRSISLFGFLITFVACTANCRTPGDRPRILVAAATSVSDVLRIVADDYERRTGTAIVLNVGGSDTLATQLLAGAPGDLFLSADERQMNRVEARGGIRVSTRVDLLTNQLVVVSAAEHTPAISHVEDLLTPRVRRIAMGDPDAVPAGVYARQYLQSVGLWEAIRSKVVPTRDVRAAMAAVGSGNADVGFVYRTDLAVDESIGLAFAIPVDEGPRIRYPAAVLVDAVDESAARHFLGFLGGLEAKRIFTGAGFETLEVDHQ